ncbi:histidine kinase dimerization/phospho-acceptor domain-containing protein [Pedobacter sp. JY14-1]|uniref:histidine kinase dimerization/phospho-acceptor domain-containing protein n=1 Tax=Pedobacter sp. JY14-1 TaxID=3034151 RepID=UPI0023E1FFD4|nr:histidine kinase dimerization/phospho-acceptor domain-containing protein [Pedobacter sp. JY14-1]
MMKVVAHDLRNPMGSIHMIASLMLHRSKLSTEDQELAEMMKRSSKNCLDLVDDLMRPKAMDQTFAVQREELSEVCVFALTS